MNMAAAHSSEAEDTETAPSSLSGRLSTREICAEIERLAEVERRTEWLLCRHLAELADRFERHVPELHAPT